MFPFKGKIKLLTPVLTIRFSTSMDPSCSIIKKSSGFAATFLTAEIVQCLMTVKIFGFFVTFSTDSLPRGHWKIPHMIVQKKGESRVVIPIRQTTRGECGSKTRSSEYFLKQKSFHLSLKAVSYKVSTVAFFPKKGKVRCQKLIRVFRGCRML